MTLSECAYEERPTGLQAALDEESSPGPNVVEKLVDQLSDVIYGLVSHRPDSSDGVAWISFDTALCGLHSALVALEEFGGVHTLDRRPPNSN